MNTSRLLWLLFLLVTSSRHAHTQAGAGDRDAYSPLLIAPDIPDATVTGLAQDSLGFVWIGTRIGLFRYDGVRYKFFRNGPPGERNLTFNLIRRLHLSRRHLVVEGQRQVNIIDIGTERLRYASPGELIFSQSLRHGEDILFHFEDNARNTLLFRLGATGALDSIPLRLPAGMRMDRACYDGKNTVFFFDNTSRLWQLSLREQALTCLDTSTFIDRRPLRLPILHADRRGTLWAFDRGEGTYASLMKWSVGSGFVRVLDLTNDISIQPGGTPDDFWFLQETTDRLFRVDLADPAMHSIAWLPPGNRGAFTCVLADQHGNLWIGTQFGPEKGILLLRPHLKAFDKLMAQAGKEADIGLACRSIDQLADGTIVSGSRDGLFMIDPATQQARRLELEIPGSSLKMNGLWKIVVDPGNDRIWFTKEEGGLFEYRIHDQVTTSYLPRNQVSDRALGLLLDPGGLLWIGTRTGIAWFDTRTKAFDLRPAISAQFSGISGYNWVMTRPDEIWLCSSNGLYQFASDRRVVRRIGTDTEPYLHSNEVYDIIRQDSVYWIATDNGLHQWSNGRIVRSTTDDGLPHNIIASLQADDAGRIWIATFNGLSCLDPGTGLFQNFYVTDGLPHNEFNRQGKFRDADGRLYFATQNGIVRFDPTEPYRDIPPPRLILTGFSAFDRQGGLVRFPVDRVNGLQTLDIPAGNKYFQLDFALLNFIKSGDNRYAYYLEDLEKDWRPLIRSPFLQYNNLPAGEYTLHIRAMSPEGRWAGNTLDIRVRVREHLYQTTWFKLLAILSVFAIAIGYVRLRLVRRLDLERMRNKISADLHDEVGGVLSGIAMQMDLLENRSPDPLRPFMQRIASSSRNAALTMRDVIWSIDAGKDTLGDLADRMKAYTVELLSPLDIRYSFDFSGIQSSQGIPVDVRQNVYLIFKEALNNAMKHSGGTHVHIRLEKRKSHLVMVVSDDGQGPGDRRPGGGQGMGNMEKRARRIHGDLSIGPGMETGTIVRLSCPLSR